MIALLPYYLFSQSHTRSGTDIDIANTHAARGTFLTAVNPKALISLVKVRGLGFRW